MLRNSRELAELSMQFKRVGRYFSFRRPA